MEARSNFPDSLKTGLLAYYDDEFNRYQPMYDKCFNVLGSTKQSEEFSGATGIGELVETAESGPYTYEDEIEDYKTILTHKTFKRGIQVTEEQAEDDQYRKPAARLTKLGYAAARTADSKAYSVFRNAFNTAYTSYGDGKPFLSTLHPRLDGGSVRSNASATNAALSETNLEVGMLAGDEVVDHKGQMISGIGRGWVLMIPPALRKKALEICKSPARSNTTDNDLNYYLEFGDLDIFVNPWISAAAGGSDTAWFLYRKGTNALKFIWRVKPTMFTDTDAETGALKLKCRARFSFGFLDPIGEVWGSKGTGTGSYSS